MSRGNTTQGECCITLDTSPKCYICHTYTQVLYVLYVLSWLKHSSQLPQLLQFLVISHSSMHYL